MLPTCLGEYVSAMDTRMMMEEVKKILGFEFGGTVYDGYGTERKIPRSIDAITRFLGLWCV